MDKRALYESIMQTVSKEVKKSLNEYRTKAIQETYEIDENDIKKYLNMTPEAWIVKKIEKIPDIRNSWKDGWSDRRDGGLKVNASKAQTYYNPNADPNAYTVSVSGTTGYFNDKESVVSDLETIYRYLAQHKEFHITSAKMKTDLRITVTYYISKDGELYKAIEDAKVQHEQNVANADTTAYAPTERDWVKMVGYMNGHSNPERVAKSCKDPNKVVARCIIAKTLGWKDAEREFRYRIKELNILSDIEIEAYQRKYATYNIPEDIKMLVDDTAEFDETGGIASNKIENAEILPDNVKKYIHNNKDIRSYTIELLGQIPLKKMAGSRYSTSYSIGNVNLAKVTFKMVDGSEKDTWFVYGRGYAHFSKYQPNQAWKDEIGSGAHAVHNLEYIFGE